MSTRARRKWLKGVHAGSQTSSKAELQVAEYAAFGAWILNQCPVDPEAQRLVAMWQQSTQPARPRRKLLNTDVLASIASAAAQKRLERKSPATNVAEIYVLNKQSQRIVRRKLEACDSVHIEWGTVVLRGPHAEAQRLDETLFCALLEHNELVFPEVVLTTVARTIPSSTNCSPTPTADVFVVAVSALPARSRKKHFEKRFLGIERLRLPHMSAWRMWSSEDIADFIHKNQGSLKVLEMPMELFSVLPPGLKLEEFITRADPYNFEDGGIMSPAFLRTVIADEVHLEISDILPNDPDPPASQPPNSRVKKLAVDVGSVEIDDFYFDRIVRDVFAMCPALECLELASTFVNWPRSAWAALDHGEVDSLIAKFEQEVEECVAPFTICFKALFASFGRSRAEVSDNVRQCFDVDLPPACRVHEGREHYHLVKETCFDKKSLRMDFKISVEPCW